MTGQKNEVIVENAEMNMVLVTWFDCTSITSGVYTTEEVKDLTMIEFKSLGFLVYQNKQIVAIAQELDELEKYRYITLIPTKTVISIVEVVKCTD